MKDLPITNIHKDGYSPRTRISGVKPYKKKRLKSPKGKGDLFERELADYLKTHLGIPAHRAALSGGGFSWARGIAPGADLTGTPKLWVEAKRVEKFNPHNAMAQAVKGSQAHHNADIPVVVTRRNRQELCDSLVVMRLKDFLKFYSALLAECGQLPVIPVQSSESSESSDPPKDSPDEKAPDPQHDGHHPRQDADQGQ